MLNISLYSQNWIVQYIGSCSEKKINYSIKDSNALLDINEYNDYNFLGCYAGKFQKVRTLSKATARTTDPELNNILGSK